MSRSFDRAAKAELCQLVELLEGQAQTLGVRPEMVQQLRYVLQQGLQALDSFSSAQERLLAHVSHELRTPLTPALLAVCLLQRDKALPPAVREALAMIQANIEQEARLIDNLIDQAACSATDPTEPARTPRLRIA
jgi:signal transduction histidine kinase